MLQQTIRQHFSFQDYRKHVLATVPTLIKLDFSGVTRTERDTVETWRKLKKDKTKKKPSEDQIYLIITYPTSLFVSVYITLQIDY